MITALSVITGGTCLDVERDEIKCPGCDKKAKWFGYHFGKRIYKCSKCMSKWIITPWEQR